LGKVENYQVGVALGYSHKNQRILIHGKLYLPEEWAKNRELRSECKVPKEVQFRTKAQIGLDMILNARKNGVPFGWIGMDCFYDEQPWLREKLDAEGLIFIADIPRDTRVWLSRPKTGIPERSGKRGRQPICEKFLMANLRQLRFKRSESRLILHNGYKSRSGTLRERDSRSILFAFASIQLKTNCLGRNCGSSSEKR
jgi:SRSO17 transposase